MIKAETQESGSGEKSQVQKQKFHFRNNTYILLSNIGQNVQPEPEDWKLNLSAGREYANLPFLRTKF